MDERVLPNEHVLDREDDAAEALVAQLRVEVKDAGLWAPHVPPEAGGTGTGFLDYAYLNEQIGRTVWGQLVFGCQAPDAGNAEILHLFGTDEQKERWLRPLLEGEIRSCFAMTEPAVASSDATNIALRIERDGDHYVLNGHKWWISGAARERCRVAIVMGKTDTAAPPHRQQSMVLVPMDAPGLENLRSLPVFGYQDNEGHCELVFRDVRVPVDHLLGEEGGGFAMAQARLGPGRIHHCMRAIGVAERALELMCRRVRARTAFGKPLADQGVIQQWIADSRIEIEQVRLLVLKTAWLMDTVGNKGARIEVSAIKVAAPDVALRVVDRAIQAHGALGVSDDAPLASMYAHVRTLRLADGPDEVHRMSVARRELRKYEEAQGRA
jgi:acyl-CoA dehydrogenase